MFDNPITKSTFVINISFSHVTFKDCVFNFVQFVKCTFYSCKFINCKWESSLGFYKSEFFGCDIESIPSKIKDHLLIINECVFKYCDFKDTKIDEMSLWMTMFYYCSFPYKICIISNGFSTKFILPDKKNDEQLMNSLESSFDPIPDEYKAGTFNEMEFPYKEIKNKE